MVVDDEHTGHDSRTFPTTIGKLAKDANTDLALAFRRGSSGSLAADEHHSKVQLVGEDVAPVVSFQIGFTSRDPAIAVGGEGAAPTLHPIPLPMG